MVNHCQNQFSCFSCCGLFNLKLNTDSQYQLLNERTEHLKKLMNNSLKLDRLSLLNYRLERELIENQIDKYNYEVYVCPFLGFINNSRIGCMIHPSITNDQKSQDVSFYGSSICLSYDCRVKEEDSSFFYKQSIEKMIELILESNQWDDFLKESGLNKNIFIQHFIYSRFIGDFVFYRFVEFYFDLKSIIENEDFLYLFTDLCMMRLKYNQHVTSFEINYNTYIEDKNQFCDDFKKIFLLSDNENFLCYKYFRLLKKAYVDKSSS